MLNVFFFLGYNKLTDETPVIDMSANLHTLSWISECNLISDLSVAKGQGASLTFGHPCL